MPIGILGGLVICTVIYMIVGAVATGLVPYSSSAADPLAPRPRAGGLRPALVDRRSAPWSRTAVLLVFQLGQPRIFFSMARDGLLPAGRRRSTRVPHAAHHHDPHRLLVGVLRLVADDNEIYDLTNIGTLFAFVVVCIGVLVLRLKEPTGRGPSACRSSGPVFTGAAACIFVMAACRRTPGSGFFFYNVFFRSRCAALPRPQPQEHRRRLASRQARRHYRLSSSGKSSLAFGDLRGRTAALRRMLSSCARQFLEQMEKPDVDLIDGCSLRRSPSNRRRPDRIGGRRSGRSRDLRLSTAAVRQHPRAALQLCGREISSQSLERIIDTGCLGNESLCYDALRAGSCGAAGELREELAALRARLHEVRVDEHLDRLERSDAGSRAEPTTEVVVGRVIAQARDRATPYRSVELHWISPTTSSK